MRTSSGSGRHEGGPGRPLAPTRMTPTRVELLYLLATLSFLPAILRAARVWPRLDTGARRFAVWLGLDLLVSLAFVLLQAVDLHISAQRFAAFAIPVEKLVLFLALAAWQVDARMRGVVTGLAVAALAFWVPGLGSWRASESLGVGLVTVQALLVVAVATFVLARRWLEGTPEPRAQPWFWVASGLVLFYGLFALVPPLTGYFLSVQQEQHAEVVLALRSGVQGVAAVLFWLAYRNVPLPDGAGRAALARGAAIA